MTFLHQHKIARLILCAGLLTSCDQTNSKNADDPPSEMESFMAYGIHNTPYAALIRNTSSDVEPLPDADESDDYALVQWNFTAEVLETYRGPPVKTVSYTVETEKGEIPNLGEAPFIILLCQSGDAYYWPGVGFNFPAGERAKKIAKSAGEKSDKKQKTFVECHDE